MVRAASAVNKKTLYQEQGLFYCLKQYVNPPWYFHAFGVEQDSYEHRYYSDR